MTSKLIYAVMVTNVMKTLHLRSVSAHFLRVTLLQKKSNVWATLKYTIGVSREVHPRNCREQEGAAEIIA